VADVNDFNSFNRNPVSSSTLSVTCAELQKKIESLQHQNKVLKLDLEINKLMEVELETYKMKMKLLQRQCNTNKVSYNSTANGIISCENCEILKNQLSSAQDELDSVKLVNKLLQDDLELLRANLEKLKNKCTNDGINDTLPKRLKVSKEERKSDSKVNHPTLEYIPVIINQISKSDMRN
jgi:hypothetical protein